MIPLVNEIILGKTIKEFVEEYSSEYPLFAADSEWWEKFVSLLIMSKVRDIKFVEQGLGTSDCVVFSPQLPIRPLKYKHDDWVNPEDDCYWLSRFVEDFYPPKKATLYEKAKKALGLL